MTDEQAIAKLEALGCAVRPIDDRPGAYFVRYSHAIGSGWLGLPSTTTCLIEPGQLSDYAEYHAKARAEALEEERETRAAEMEFFGNVMRGGKIVEGEWCDDEDDDEDDEDV